MRLKDALEELFHRYIHAGRFAADRALDGELFVRRLGDGPVPVIYTAVGRKFPLGAAHYVGRALAGKPAVFLAYFSWSSRRRRTARRSAIAAAVYRDLRPEHKFLFLCNDDTERASYAEAGLDALLCNHNAFVDERIFTPADADVRHDAVYNAAMAGWKRHKLSRLIESCVQITYKRTDVSPNDTLALLDDLKRSMPSHHFANASVGGQIQLMRSAEVAGVLNQSRCGLCLSAVEGAMLASIEYLLAGLPVVSTASIGGRDEFADPQYWLTVADTPEAVAAGVQEMIGRNIPRALIRAKTLARMHEHRERLRNAVARVTKGSTWLPTDLSDKTYRFMSDMGTWPNVTELATILRL